MEPEEWFWEGHVQRRVENHLCSDGWQLLSSADTYSRQTGIDLVLEREGQRLNVEVKGWPSTTYRRGPKAGQPKPTNPTVQARHWYAGALLTSALLRDVEPDTRVALAFPDFPRYRDLLRRTSASLAALGVEALLVADDGNVSWVDPAELPPPESKRVTPRASRSTDLGTSSMSSSVRLTLHEAMVVVLQDAPGGCLTVGDLADEINRRGLYRMRDGRAVAPGQIHARARNYRHLFDAGGGSVTVRR